MIEMTEDTNVFSEHMNDLGVEEYCEFMHNVYEEAAIISGWATNPRSAVPWKDVPESNKMTMRVAVGKTYDKFFDDYRAHE